MRLENHVMRGGSLRPSNFHVSNYHPPLLHVLQHSCSPYWISYPSRGSKTSREHHPVTSRNDCCPIDCLVKYLSCTVNSLLTRHVAETRMHGCLTKAPCSTRLSASHQFRLVFCSVLRVHIGCYCISECHYYDIQNAHRLLEGPSHVR